MVFAGRHRESRHSLNAQLVPDRLQVAGLVELHLVGNGAGAEVLVGCVLQVPAGLVLLHEFADHGPLVTALALLGHNPPHLEILCRISILVFGGALPGNDVSA